MCRSFWSNYHFYILSTSKWLSEFQFCERYSCSWRKNGHLSVANFAQQSLRAYCPNIYTLPFCNHEEICRLVLKSFFCISYKNMGILPFDDLFGEVSGLLNVWTFHRKICSGTLFFLVFWLDLLLHLFRWPEEPNMHPWSMIYKKTFSLKIFLHRKTTDFLWNDQKQDKNSKCATEWAC